jgi:hypothetical protein
VSPPRHVNGGTPAERTKVRAAITAYCRDAIAHAPTIHYSQHRPLTALGVAPAHGFTTDCSGLVVCAYRWARDRTMLRVPDPGGYAYGGAGWTGSLIRNPTAGGTYWPGDVAIYGSSSSRTTHATICMVAGDRSSSVWCSHGSEAGPYAVRLHYRSDLLKVCRPRLVS